MGKEGGGGSWLEAGTEFEVAEGMSENKRQTAL